MNIRRIGLDLAKNVFTVCGVDEHGQVVVRKTLRRDQVLAWQVSRSVVGMEACSGAHYWARELMRLGGTMRGSWTFGSWHRIGVRVGWGRMIRMMPRRSARRSSGARVVWDAPHATSYWLRAVAHPDPRVACSLAPRLLARDDF